MGIPLHRIKNIRELYKEDPALPTLINFSDPLQKPRPNGHVIAVRITSENPDEGFKPSPGIMEELNFKSNRSVWGYFSVSSVGGIHEFSDSQFGHCFSFAETREKAREWVFACGRNEIGISWLAHAQWLVEMISTIALIRNMVLTLKEMSIRGDFRTTVEYLIKILESESFVMNDIDTGWLDLRISQKVQVLSFLR